MREDGIQLKSTRHAKYQSGHHFVWIPLKRRKIFRDEQIIEATKKYVTEAIENNGMKLLAIEVDRTLMDHVHVFVSIPPRLSASDAVNVMKGTRFYPVPVPSDPIKTTKGAHQTFI